MNAIVGIHLRPEGRAQFGIDFAANCPELWRGHARRAELIRQALTAQELFSSASSM